MSSDRIHTIPGDGVGNCGEIVTSHPMRKNVNNNQRTSEQRITQGPLRDFDTPRWQLHQEVLTSRHHSLRYNPQMNDQKLEHQDICEINNRNLKRNNTSKWIKPNMSISKF